MCVCVCVCVFVCVFVCVCVCVCRGMLVLSCVWSSKKYVDFEYASNVGGVHGVREGTNIDKAERIECQTLESILTSHGVTKVDFMSVDIEGSEIEVLGRFPFHKFDIGMVLIETFWLDPRVTDRLFTINGYAKVASVSIDDLYVKMPQPLLMPPNWEWQWQDKEAFRATKGRNQTC